MFEVDAELMEMSFIEPVMVNNGFTREGNLFRNDKCEVVVDFKDYCYHIYYKSKTGRVMLSSDNLNIYFLFGYLSAHELIDRNFKI